MVQRTPEGRLLDLMIKHKALKLQDIETLIAGKLRTIFMDEIESERDTHSKGDKDD